ncbi:hypothetical protein COLO4_10671 [Corchorus olitorius]|uniref:Uncharacterized protein n=1 Tax=Corchorus olitorius TaxID=93759 RepID=A0A1R3K790_9ROSI|nr:hypothetical protein COLO4_10671 [Corchorus olitorius]
MNLSCVQPLSKVVVPNSLVLVPCPGSSSFLRNLRPNPSKLNRVLRCYEDGNPAVKRRRGRIVCAAGGLFPVDPWAPNIDSQSIASQLFAFSLFPYIGFLYFITKSKSSPKLTLFGFYFLLAFVGATIPAGIYAKVKYGTSLSNVDWLHGGAESLLTLTNLFIVVGLRQALRKTEDAKESTSTSVSECYIVVTINSRHSLTTYAIDLGCWLSSKSLLTDCKFAVYNYRYCSGFSLSLIVVYVYVYILSAEPERQDKAILFLGRDMGM